MKKVLLTLVGIFLLNTAFADVTCPSVIKCQNQICKPQGPQNYPWQAVSWDGRQVADGDYYFYFASSGTVFCKYMSRQGQYAVNAYANVLLFPDKKAPGNLWVGNDQFSTCITNMTDACPFQDPK
jgi:hypothetical protein